MFIPFDCLDRWNVLLRSTGLLPSYQIAHVLDISEDPKEIKWNTYVCIFSCCICRTFQKAFVVSSPIWLPFFPWKWLNELETFLRLLTMFLNKFSKKGSEVCIICLDSHEWKIIMDLKSNIFRKKKKRKIWKKKVTWISIIKYFEFAQGNL